MSFIASSKLIRWDLLAYLILGIVVLSVFPKWSEDDFYILARYADNFKQHGELVWNLGQRFEGYTGHLLLFSLIVSPLDYLTTTHIIGVLSYLLGMVSLYAMFSDRVLRLLAIISWTLAPAILVHTFSGLETVMFMSLILLAGVAWLKKKNWLLLASLILVSMTRPEGILFSVVMIWMAWRG